jgi:hypothetical protein
MLQIDRAAAREMRERPAEGQDAERPDVSVVVPVNAQGDLKNVRSLLDDVAAYKGPHSVETVLVVNNFPAGRIPPEVAELRRTGAVVLTIPSVRRPGEAVGFSARIPGLRVASAPYAVLFDADCRVPDATALLNWYVEQLRQGAFAAYTPVAFYEFDRSLSLRAFFAVHYAARWVKRCIFRIPTTRGSNYAVRCEAVLDLYEQGLLADEMNVGPTVKRFKGPVSYASGKPLTVLTSGRMLDAGWGWLAPYFLRRLRYNMRVLPVRPGVAGVTGRERDPVRRYRDNRPVRDEAGPGGLANRRI